MKKVYQVIADSSLSGAPRHVLTIVKHLSPDDFDLTLVCPKGWLFDQAQKIGIKIIKINFSGFLDIASVSKLRKILRRDSPDLVHLHGVRAGWLGTLSSSGLKLKIVYTEHLYTKDFHLESKARELMQIAGLNLVVNKARRVIAPSNAVKDFLVNKFKISRGKIKVIPNGLDDLKKKGYKEEAKIGFIGGLNRQKGVDVLIDAYKKIIKSHSSLKLEIMGDGPLREKMKKRAKWAKDRINFLGLRSDIAPILSSWKILIVPSRSESFGQVVIEAAMLSKPVVATNVGGLPEVVGDNITGLLVNNDNPDALARAVIYLLARPKKIKIMGIKARKRFEKFFTAERMIAEIEKVYKKILEIK